MAAPDKIRIAYEDSEYGRFNTIGKLPDGTQFMAFLTGAFTVDYFKYPNYMWRHKKKWLAVVHKFDVEGNHVGSEARTGGFEIEGRLIVEEKALVHFESMLTELASAGPPIWTDIWVRPFSIEIDEVVFSLIYQQQELEDDYVLEEGEEREAWVMLEPNDIMFHPPWDSGEYSS